MSQVQRNNLNNPEIVNAIMAVANDGIVLPEEVVKAAKKKNSPLHSYFEWDDSIAAQEWRIHQARNLIRVVVQMVEMPDKTKREVNVFVSLPSDRNDKGGYRIMTDVLSDEDRKQEMLASALNDLRTIRNKYESLKELAGVFAEIDKLKISA